MSRSQRLVVTGGGSGIGRAVCAGAAARGWSVAALDRDAAGLAATAERTGAVTVTCDVTDEVAVEAAVAEAATALGGPPDALVAAAGVYEIRPAAATSAADFARVLSINAVGAFLVARAVVRGLVEQGAPGSVVFLASMAADVGDDAEPAVAYSASKGAVVSMTRQLAVEWAGSGVRVNAVSPGVIDTPMLRLMDDPEQGARFVRDAVPLSRLGRAEEVAEACLFLVDDASAYVTGAILPVDGGAIVR